MDKLTKRKIQALKTARDLIATRSEDYLCNALYSAGAHPKLAEAANRLISYIRRELGGNVVLGFWQHFNLPEGTHDFVQIREDRIAWIDWMIEQLRNKN